MNKPNQDLGTDGTSVSEGALQAAMVETAHRLGWVVARFPAANFVRQASGKSFVKPLAHETKGWPDCVFVRERVVLVEFKAAKGKLSPEQVVWLDRLLRAGVEAYVCRPADADDLSRVLAARGPRLVFVAAYGLVERTRAEVDRELAGQAAAVRARG